MKLSTSASNETSPAGGPPPPPPGGPAPHQSLPFSSSQGDLQQQPNHLRRTVTSNSSFLGQLFRPRKTSRSDVSSTGVEV